MRYVFGGYVRIRGNSTRLGTASNVVAYDAANIDQTAAFFFSEIDGWDDAESAVLSSNSDIGITMRDWVGTDDSEYKTFAYETWLNESKDTGSIHTKIFHSDDDTYIVAKRVNSIILTKEVNDRLVATGFDPYDVNAVYDNTVQYLYVDSDNSTLADEPIAPTGPDPFVRWNANEYLSAEYFFDGSSGTALDGEGTPRIATIYGLWRRDQEITVVTNTGGHSSDGSALSDVHLGTEVVAVATLSVPMGSQLKDSTSIRYNGHTYVSPTDVDLTVRPDFVRDGMSTTRHWWTGNGYHGGLNDQDTWGEEFMYDGLGDISYNVVKDMTLYVRWQGDPYNMYYEYYDMDVFSTVSEVTANKYVDPITGYDYSVQHYNSLMEMTEATTIFTPVRHGYRFVNWHSSPSEMFSAANVVTKDTVYLWHNDITLYAEWEPVDYEIRFTAKDGEVDDGQGHTAGVATVSSFNLSFDKGYREPTYRLSNVPFERNGYTLASWDYNLDQTDPRDIGNIGVNEVLGDRNLYNARVEETSPDVWEEIATYSTLNAVWEANTYRLIFDLNDGSAGNADVYKGSNFVSTISETGGAADGFEDATYDAAKNYWYMDVVYDSEVNSLGFNLAEPTRLGYTFGGWFK